jgi:hypothetical protein
VAFWLGLAAAVGAVVRSIGHSARELEPEHRRDGVGLFLFALAVVTAAAVWWQVPGSVMDGWRTVVAGSVGKVAWFVPLLMVFVGWRNLRDPEHNGPAGRQAIGWTALGFGVLGRRCRRLRRGRAAARPAPLDVRRRTASGAAGRLRRAGDHRDARLPDPRAPP